MYFKGWKRKLFCGSRWLENFAPLGLCTAGYLFVGIALSHFHTHKQMTWVYTHANSQFCEINETPPWLRREYVGEDHSRLSHSQIYVLIPSHAIVSKSVPVSHAAFSEWKLTWADEFPLHPVLFPCLLSFPRASGVTGGLITGCESTWNGHGDNDDTFW